MSTEPDPETPQHPPDGAPSGDATPIEEAARLAGEALTPAGAAEARAAVNLHPWLALHAEDTVAPGDSDRHEVYLRGPTSFCA